MIGHNPVVAVHFNAVENPVFRVWIRCVQIDIVSGAVRCGNAVRFYQVYSKPIR